MAKSPPKRSKRPPDPDAKNAVVRMRIKAEHKRVLEQAAERDGLELSQWLRQLALRAAGVLPEPK